MNRQGYAKLNKVLIAILLAVLITAVILATTISLAAYTHSSRAQRTIAAYDTGGELFSSNYLLKETSSTNLKTLYVTNGSTKPSTYVTVCNYRQGIQTRSYDDDITYNVKARLVYFDGAQYAAVTESHLTSNNYRGENFQIKITFDGDTITLGETGNGTGVYVFSDESTFTSKVIEGGEINSDSYTVVFGTGFAPINANLYLEMIVEVVDPAHTFSDLKGIFNASLKIEGANNNWTGSFSDNQVYSAAIYDGYNYVISGAGSGTFRLQWDSRVVTLSYESMLLLGGSLSSINTSASPYYELSFSVNSDVVNRYEIQFYKVNVPENQDWESMNSGDLAASTVVRYGYSPS